MAVKNFGENASLEHWRKKLWRIWKLKARLIINSVYQAVYTQNNIQRLLASTCSAASAVIMMFSFAVNSMIRGNHEYKSVWESPAADDDLLCKREVGNPHDTHAVAIAGDIKTVGHIPRRISSISSGMEAKSNVLLMVIVVIQQTCRKEG